MHALLCVAFAHTGAFIQICLGQQKRFIPPNPPHPLPNPPLVCPRSLRQLRREVADRLASKQAAAPTGLDSEEEEEEAEEEYIGAAVVSCHTSHRRCGRLATASVARCRLCRFHTSSCRRSKHSARVAFHVACCVQAGSEELLGALGALSLETGVHHGLRGLPTRERHLGSCMQCPAAAALSAAMSRMCLGAPLCHPSRAHTALTAVHVSISALPCSCWQAHQVGNTVPVNAALGPAACPLPELQI